MKKSIIALAVLAASGAAMAQSSVTLFGRVDTSIGSEKITSTNAAGVTSTTSTTKLFNGNEAGLTGSRWGMRGTEDLGGGLKAVFALENRFNVDTGASAGGFLGNAFVGLSGGFGTVHLGRTYSAFDDAKAISVASNVFDSSFTGYTSAGYEVRGENQLKYVTPSFGGFSAIGTVALKEAGPNTKNTTSLAAIYAGGPIKAALGFQTRAAVSTATPPVQVTGDNIILSADYNFGVASVSAGYSVFAADSATTQRDQAGLSVGVTVPVGAMKFSVGFGVNAVETQAGAEVQDQTSFGLGATYSMSKRTTLYVGFNDKKSETPAGVKTSGTRLFAAGIRHDF